MTSNCKRCGESFVPKKRRKTFCSRDCFFLYRKESSDIVLNCDFCGTSFIKKASRYRESIKKGVKLHFCSRSCSSKRTGKQLGLLKSHFDDMSPFRYVHKRIMARVNHPRTIKDIEVNVTPEDLKEIWELQGGRCPYTQATLVINYRPWIKATNQQDPVISPMNELLNVASLDRIDSYKGYNKDNIEFVSKGVNYLKNDKSKQEVLEFFDFVKTGSLVASSS